MNILFSPSAFIDLQKWKSDEKKIYSKILSLINDIERSPFDGIGKPEPLEHELSGFWSRRINLEHRLVYKVENDTIFIASCRYHYK